MLVARRSSVGLAASTINVRPARELLKNVPVRAITFIFPLDASINVLVPKELKLC